MQSGPRKCPRCEQTKPLEDFSIDSKTADGIGTHCKRCDTAKRKEREVRAVQKEAARVEALWEFVNADGLSSWEQVECLLAELARLAHDQEAEVSRRNRQIIKVKQDSDLALVDMKEQEAAILRLIEAFTGELYNADALAVKTFPAGSVRVCQGRCQVEPNRNYVPET